MNNIKIHRPINSRYAFEADEFAARKTVFDYDLTNETERSAEEIAELVFHMTNAPKEMLSEQELKFASAFRDKGNYSLSTGDIVEVDGEHFLCESIGWRKVDRAIMQQMANSNHGQDI
jgi:hypothetical protein